MKWMQPYKSIFRESDTFGSLMNDFDNIFSCDDRCSTNERGDVIYTLDVPGFNKDNLKVEVAEGILTISGESEVRKKSSYGRGRIMKRFEVGRIEDAEAVIKDGVLTVTLKYPSKEVNVREIKIGDGKDCECVEDGSCECHI